MNDFTCPDCGFTSSGWPTKKARDDRKRQHKAEHETGTPMPELNDTKES